jgi:hypothetical protein
MKTNTSSLISDREVLGEEAIEKYGSCSLNPCFCSSKNPCHRHTGGPVRVEYVHLT